MVPCLNIISYDTLCTSRRFSFAVSIPQMIPVARRMAGKTILVAKLCVHLHHSGTLAMADVTGKGAGIP